MAPGKLRFADKTTEASQALQHPTTVTKLWSFLELCNVHRHFVPKFAKLTAPLYKNLKKGEPLQFNLDGEEMKVVDVLKLQLITSPVMALSRSNGQYTIDADARDTQVGVVLQHE